MTKTKKNDVVSMEFKLKKKKVTMKRCCFVIIQTKNEKRSKVINSPHSLFTSRELCMHINNLLLLCMSALFSQKTFSISPSNKFK